MLRLILIWKCHKQSDTSYFHHKHSCKKRIKRILFLRLPSKTAFTFMTNLSYCYFSSQYRDVENLINPPRAGLQPSAHLPFFSFWKENGVIANSCNWKPSDVSTKQKQQQAVNSFSLLLDLKACFWHEAANIKKEKNSSYLQILSAVEFYLLQVLKVESFRSCYSFSPLKTVRSLQ